MALASMVSLVPFMERCKSKKNEPKDSLRNVFFSLMACFAAGMIMTISLLHILPEAHEKYNGILAEKLKEREEAEVASHEESVAAHWGHDDHSGEAGSHQFPLPYLLF
jgi:hypothetical protein